MLVKQEHYSDYIIRTFNLKRVSCCCRCCCRCQRPLDSEIYKYKIFTIISGTKQCSRVSQRHFGGKRDSRRHDVLVASHGNKLSNIRRFIILRSEDCLTSFNKDKRYDFSGGRKVQSNFPWCLFFEKSNPVLVVILFLKSKALCDYSFVQLSAIPAFFFACSCYLVVVVNFCKCCCCCFCSFFTAFTSCRQCCGCFGFGVAVALKER